MPARQVEKVLKFIGREEEEEQTEAVARQLSVPYVNLVSYPILGDILRLVPQELATNHHLVAYLKVEQNLYLATSRPTNPELPKILATIKDATQLESRLVLCSETSLRYALKLYDTLPTMTETQEKVTVTEQQAKGWEKTITNLTDLKQQITRVPTTELLDVIFAGAMTARASDIHLEPTDDGLRVRYRIDGVLEDVTTLPHEAYKSLRSRIKYLAKLKLDVTTTPQDGRFAAEALGKPIDIRVSLIPGSYGEFIVMRLLFHETTLLSLDQLGFRPDALTQIRQAIHKPHGIIFNTGPTGSGKTTTLYAVLNDLNKPGVKIITLEDPIEYRIPGINQSQIEPERDYDFADGLRSVLRQDPDIILVGEVRDAETANTAIHAALTGHLVLTTLHTNSAAATLPRLIDMGVPPFLLAGSVNLIIGQRLVRRICATCWGTGRAIHSTPEVYEKNHLGSGMVCPTCAGTGFKGRLAIVEVLAPNEQMNQLIIQKAPVAAFEEAARASGMVTMEHDGLAKVQQGLTTREEVARVTQE